VAQRSLEVAEQGVTEATVLTLWQHLEVADLVAQVTTTAQTDMPEFV
jgi:hypothetical protein